MNIQTACFLPTKFFTLLTAVTVCTLFMLTTVGSSAFAQSGNANPQVQSQRKPKRGIVGQQAPKWETSKWIGLPTGKTSFDISDVKGKVTYLYFFQSWCPGCHQRGFPTLKALEEKFRDKKDVQFVAIQTTFEGHRTNTPDKLEVMSKRYNLKIPFGQSKGTSGTRWSTTISTSIAMRRPVLSRNCGKHHLQRQRQRQRPLPHRQARHSTIED